MAMIDIDPKLLKIVALAKNGVGGEKETALKIVKKLCKEFDLQFNDVMGAVDFREYSITYDRNNELNIVAQICFKFATTKDHPGVRFNQYRKQVFVVTTPAMYIETMQAIAVYINAYRRERRKIISDLPDAFIYKHSLFGGFDHNDDEPRKLLTSAEKERAFRQAALSRNMDDVELYKGIESRSSNESSK